MRGQGMPSQFRRRAQRPAAPCSSGRPSNSCWRRTPSGNLSAHPPTIRRLLRTRELVRVRGVDANWMPPLWASGTPRTDPRNIQYGESMPPTRTLRFRCRSPPARNIQYGESMPPTAESRATHPNPWKRRTRRRCPLPAQPQNPAQPTRTLSGEGVRRAGTGAGARREYGRFLSTRPISPTRTRAVRGPRSGRGSRGRS